MRHVDGAHQPEDQREPRGDDEQQAGEREAVEQRDRKLRGVLDRRFGRRVVGQHEHPERGQPDHDPHRHDRQPGQQRAQGERAADRCGRRICHRQRPPRSPVVEWSASHNAGIPSRMQDQIPGCIQLWMHIDIPGRLLLACDGKRPARPSCVRGARRGRNTLRKGFLHDARLALRRRVSPSVPAGPARARSRGRRRRRARQYDARRPHRTVRRLVLDVAVPHAPRPAPAGRRRGRPPLLDRRGGGDRAHRLGVPGPRRPAWWRIRHPGRHVRPLRRDRGRPDPDGPHHRGRRVQPDRDRAGRHRRLGAGEGAQQPGPHAPPLPRFALLRGDDRRIARRAWLGSGLDQVRQGRAAGSAGGGGDAAGPADLDAAGAQPRHGSRT